MRTVTIDLVPLDSQNFTAFAELLGGTEFGGCYCAVWTHFGQDWGDRCADTDRPNCEATRDDVERGRAAGFLVRIDGEFSAWTGSGPKREFPLLRERLGARCSEWWDDQTWCIGCVAIAQPARGCGRLEQIVHAVMDRAKSLGAKRIEAYPTDPWDEPRSYRGPLSLYARLGFREQARESDGTADIVLMSAEL